MMPAYPLRHKPPEEVKELAVFFSAFGQGVKMSGERELSDKITRAAYWLDQLSTRVCGDGYVGCYGGPNCQSDHK